MINVYYKIKYKKLKEENKKLQDDFDLLKFKYENYELIKKIESKEQILDDFVLLDFCFLKKVKEKSFGSSNFIINLFLEVYQSMNSKKEWTIEVIFFDKKNDKEITLGIKELKSIYND